MTPSSEATRDEIQTNTEKNKNPEDKKIFLVSSGIFCIALATLMYETLLTRIFSVTMYYHFAFLAISVAMFGMSFGASIVYVFNKFFKQEDTLKSLVLFSGLFSLSVVPSLLFHINFPQALDQGFWSLTSTYLAISLPFIFSGVVICLSLTRFPQRVGKIYAADLIGASFGCLAIIFIYKFTNGIGAVICASLVAGIGALIYAFGQSRKSVTAFAILSILVATGFLISQAKGDYNSVFRLKWSKGHQEPPAIYEKWNSFSRIRVMGDPDKEQYLPESYISAEYPGKDSAKFLALDIDSGAATPLFNFDGDFNKVEFLKYDISNFAHHLKPNAKVLAIGVGGGKDVLSALLFKQKSVTGVELNQNIYNSTFKIFGDYTGHLDKYPNVKIVNDEARSYVSSSKDKFNIIQVSLIDTWAASSAGAFALSENSLYTVDAWTTFIKHLEPDGYISYSRWFFNENPVEVYRLLSLAIQSLEQAGIKEPRKHILIYNNPINRRWVLKDHGLATLVLSKKTLNQEILNKAEQTAFEHGFQAILTPTYSKDKTFSQIAEGWETRQEIVKNFAFNISAPSDNKPFFFQMIKFKDAFNTKLLRQGMNSINVVAVATLGKLLVAVTLLSLAFILLPAWLSSEKKLIVKLWPISAYFGLIGLGFMLIEVSLLQRLSIFLGHPTYSLIVVLFTLLLSCGLGSHLCQQYILKSENLEATNYKKVLLSIFAAVSVLGILSSLMFSAIASYPSWAKIACSICVLFPLGLSLGLAFPVGIKLASKEGSNLLPWFWGINGATSVLGSVLAVVLALSFGINFVYLSGCICYSLTLLCLGLSKGSKSL
ncbi:MAG: hypothetical protein SFU25_03540 [Candidatus Caenarcaniphilales bacterium]|nr:hypothetical protein [Candidatus Caenarcaniphilales bacterium]